MARNLLVLVAASLLLGGCIYVEECERIRDEEREVSYAPAATQAPTRLLRHVVLLKFKDEASAADIRRIENAFSALPSRIDAIYDLEWGTDVSVENRQKGFTHCFIVSFRSEADRAEYLPHPAHREFGELLGPYLDDVLVVDYWAK
ncbi:MAG TPA: Dabb family protein [Sedimentisphaerales bacterium]|nr:Dabb family protein [Sedimentisphaerales bacterium]HRS11796.1 Dabb family protein [Sedimentisphaerales bacterium]HRV48457.1 Dabb family protein [Sedimentisphaerales bacterium]